MPAPRFLTELLNENPMPPQAQKKQQSKLSVLFEARRNGAVRRLSPQELLVIRYNDTRIQKLNQEQFKHSIKTPLPGQ